MRLKGKDVVVGVTGGIAAYKACELVSRLVKEGASVYVVMTANAVRFVAPLTFETLSNHPVVTDTFDRPQTWEVEHIALAKRAALFCVAPATANILAKMAHGIADDMLSTTLLATKAPVLVAPAMNTGMWTAPVTQENLAVLKQRGVYQVGPGAGRLACGDAGAGRMLSVIIQEEPRHDAPRGDAAPLKVAITAFPMVAEEAACRNGLIPAQKDAAQRLGTFLQGDGQCFFSFDNNGGAICAPGPVGI